MGTFGYLIFSSYVYKMKEQLVTFETAKLAKEKGFKIPCQSVYFTENSIDSNSGVVDWNNQRDYEFSAPTQSLLQKWLREQHRIYVTALPFRDIEAKISLCFYYSLVDEEDEDILCNENHLGASIDNYSTYEEALEKGLQAALKLI